MIALLHRIRAKRELLEKLRDRLIERREFLISRVSSSIGIDPTILRTERIRIEIKRGKYYYLRWFDGLYRSKYVPAKLVGIVEELINIKHKLELIDYEIERVDYELRRIRSHLEHLLRGIEDIIETVE